MNRKILIAAAILLVAVCFVTVILCSGSFTVQADIPQDASADDYSVATDYGRDVIELTDKSVSNGVLSLTFRPIKQGREFIIVSSPDGINSCYPVYVHLFGIVTEND